MGKILASLLVFGLLSSMAEYPAEKPSLSAGREIFISNCAGCHGEKGDGSGLKGAFNFTDNGLMITKNSSVFFDAVTNGVQGTGMPSFTGISDSQRWDVVAYLWTFWADNESVERGKNIYQKNCASCHGINGYGINGTFDFTNSSVLVRKEPEIFFMSVSDGIKGTAMLPWKDSLSEDERWDTVKYVWTFQFKDYSSSQTPLEAANRSPWYFTPVGMGIATISIILAIAILYLFGKGMQER